MVDVQFDHRRSVCESTEKTVADIITPLADDNTRLQAAVTKAGAYVFLRNTPAGYKLEHECDERDRAAIKRLRNKKKITTRRVTDEYEICVEVEALQPASE